MINFDEKKNKIWLDCDGVLANFDKLATSILEMEPRKYEEKYGSDKFWKKLSEYPNFFRNLDLMPDASRLYNFIQLLGIKPVILSGSPSQMGEQARVDKFIWVEKTFGSTQRLVVCQSKNKYMYCTPGDIIIDDWSKYKDKWLNAGGQWINHINADNSINNLEILLNIKFL